MKVSVISIYLYCGKVGGRMVSHSSYEELIKIWVCLVNGGNFWPGFFDLSSQSVKYSDSFNFMALGVGGSSYIIFPFLRWSQQDEVL